MSDRGGTVIASVKYTIPVLGAMARRSSTKLKDVHSRKQISYLDVFSYGFCSCKSPRAANKAMLIMLPSDVKVAARGRPLQRALINVRFLFKVSEE
jgi:hypothetical protein